MVARRIQRISAVVVALAAVGCAHAPPVPVTVIFDGDPAHVARLRSLLPATAVAELVLRQGTIAPPIDPSLDPSLGTSLGAELGAAEVAHAFEELVSGDGSRCRERLATVDLARLLAYRQRALVARALLLDARCAEGLGNSSAAEARFEEFASYELELAEAVGVLSPTLRTRFDLALARLGRAARVRVTVDGPVGGRVLIDGRLAACAVPCTPSVAQGPHVISVEASGFALAWRKLIVEAPVAVALPGVVASAAEATQQWHQRVGSGFAPDDAVSLGLLHLMAKDERVVYLRAAPPAPGASADSLTGAMVVRRREQASVIAARGQRSRLDEAPALVRQLAIDAKVIAPPRPRWFWPVLVGSVVTSVAVTAALLYQPETRTMVEF